MLIIIEFYVDLIKRWWNSSANLQPLTASIKRILSYSLVLCRTSQPLEKESNLYIRRECKDDNNLVAIVREIII